MADFDNPTLQRGQELKVLRQNSLFWLLAGAVCLVAGQSLLKVLAGISTGALILPFFLYLGIACGVWLGLPAHLPQRSFGLANGITLLRAVLTCLLAGLVVQTPPELLGWLPLAGALTILLLDGLDGWVARKTAQASAFGARFDMEMDSLLVLLLCATVLLMDKAGPWVLLAGGLRYIFLAGTGLLPWMKGTLPESFRRKALYVISTCGVILALAPVVTGPLSHVISVVAVAGLVISFMIDISWLYRNTRKERKSS
ncbi:CDP-alcohol phosphatidyltransferase family protein [Fodinicurvata fenggangensis]|uniref:CDP-alcohol phosphatidyltransferase family protein n=1 Tax=Fodinicurvata fenggangensis TaxID=1121830 RepID=UPI00068E6082|nr:CDP-alcohol phosphatidyltransferase family protein [Fodinicurvata fenggangensis]